jgi:hypothetical protein
MTTMNAPECLTCDDTGVVPGNEVFSAAMCKCGAGETLQQPGVRAMSFVHNEPEFTFGAVNISREGMTYGGAVIEDGGRAYRTLMAVLHGQEPNREDRHPRIPVQDIMLQDLGLMVARLAHALALHSPNDHLLRNAESILARHGMQSGVDYKALPALPRITWPNPAQHANFNLERRDDPHNMSNRHNPLNQGRRRSDREE